MIASSIKIVRKPNSLAMNMNMEEVLFCLAALFIGNEMVLAAARIRECDCRYLEMYVSEFL